MELPCLANPEPVSDYLDFPESTDPTSSVSNVSLGIELQSNVAYGSSEYVRKADSSPGASPVNSTYEEVRNVTANSQLISVRENVHSRYSPQDSLTLQSDPKDRYYNVILPERRKPSGKRGKQGRDGTACVALAALMSILLSGSVIVLSVRYKFPGVPSNNSYSQAQSATTGMLPDQYSCIREWKVLHVTAYLSRCLIY